MLFWIFGSKLLTWYREQYFVDVLFAIEFLDSLSCI